MDQITIIVVDDHPLFLQGVIDAISLSPDLAVIGQATDGDAALKVIRQFRPTVAIVDVNLPVINGQQVVRQVVSEKLSTRVVLLTAYDDPEQMVHSMRGGAAGYCSKDIQPEDLVQIVRRVAGGEYFVGDQIMDPSRLERWLVAQTESALRTYGDPGEPYYPLSAREMEVLAYVTKGMSNKEIAIALGISHQTVKNHVTAILRKLGVEDRTQAAIYALRRGWVRLKQSDMQSEE
ncbi:MAG: response regulator [Chloroflexota bacterium]